MRPVVSEVANNDQRTSQNDGGVAAHEPNLQITNHLAKPCDNPPEAVHNAVNDSEIEKLPQAFARNYQNWFDNCGVIDLVDVILVLQQQGHLPQWLRLKHDPTD